MLMNKKTFTKAYHDRLLSIGDGRQGFTLEAIPKDVKLAAQEVIAASAKAADGADALLRAQLKKRSAKYAGDDVEKQEGKGSERGRTRGHEGE